DKLQTTQEQADVIRKLPSSQQQEVFHNLPEGTQQKWAKTYFQEQSNKAESLANSLEDSTTSGFIDSGNGASIDPKTGEVVLKISSFKKSLNNSRLNFIGGTLQNEFIQNQSFGKHILETVVSIGLGFTPAGIILDIKDLAEIGLKFIENPEEMKNPWNWFDLAATVVAIVPGAGDAAKGLYKIVKTLKKAELQKGGDVAKGFYKASTTAKKAGTGIDQVHDYSKVWEQASTPLRRKIGEAIGEFGTMVWTKKNIPEGYKRILNKADKRLPSGSGYRRQGFDSIYEGKNGEIIVIESKGSIASKPTLNTNKDGTQQGTIENAVSVAEQTLKKTNISKIEKETASKVIQAHKEGKLSVKTIHTQHSNGVPKEPYLHKSDPPSQLQQGG
ncbi:MAG: hypothetical protein F6K24_25840, partial [Okeania sp. SIO2D1]|nr:hypothetical protein [Okeania sp. SIO2D1]